MKYLLELGYHYALIDCPAGMDTGLIEMLSQAQVVDLEDFSTPKKIKFRADAQIGLRVITPGIYQIEGEENAVLSCIERITQEREKANMERWKVQEALQKANEVAAAATAQHEAQTAAMSERIVQLQSLVSQMAAAGSIVDVRAMYAETAP